MLGIVMPIMIPTEGFSKMTMKGMVHKREHGEDYEIIPYRLRLYYIE